MNCVYSRPPPTKVGEFIRSIIAVFLIILISCSAYIGIQALIAPASTFICGKQVVRLTNQNTYLSERTSDLLVFRARARTTNNLKTPAHSMQQKSTFATKEIFSDIYQFKKNNTIDIVPNITLI